MTVGRFRASGHPVKLQGILVNDYPASAHEAAQGRVRRIPVVGEEVLRRQCRSVTEFGTTELEQLINDMFLTMYVADGAGLAANQVGVDLSLFVYDCFDDEGTRHVGHVLNPIVDPTPLGRRTSVEDEEGCLSVPGPRRTLYRTQEAVVRGFDKDGCPLVIEGTGYFARCLLHETDHLNGIIYIDRLSKRDRRSALQEMTEMMDQAFAKRKERAESLGADYLSA